MIKKALIGIKIVALVFAVWVVLFYRPAVIDDGAGGLYIADTSWLLDVEDLADIAKQHCAESGRSPSAFEERRAVAKGVKNNTRRFHFRCQ